jgi:hypothetical protein
MKTPILTPMFLAQFIGRCTAGTMELPEVPVPTLTMTKVVAIAQQMEAALQKANSTNFTQFTLVDIEWCKASDFSPPFSDGTQYSPLNDHPNDYSWFVTCVYRNEQMAKFSKHRFNSVHVIRIKDDGKIGVFLGVRT